MTDFRTLWTNDCLKLGEFAKVTCGACRHIDMYAPHVFARLFTPPVPIPAAERRLRCKWCGHRAAALRRMRLGTHG